MQPKRRTRYSLGTHPLTRSASIVVMLLPVDAVVLGTSWGTMPASDSPVAELIPAPQE